MRCQRGVSLCLNAPAVFEDPAFMTWLNGPTRKFTWHVRGNSVADEYSDVVVLVEPSLNGEGTDSDMPEHIWNMIIDACRTHLGPSDLALDCHITVRLTNLEE